MAMHHFCAQNGQFAPIFFVKIITTILIYLLAPFIVQNFEKILRADLEFEDAQFLGPKWPISRMRIFSENLLMNLVSFIHAYYMPKIKVKY